MSERAAVTKEESSVQLSDFPIPDADIMEGNPVAKIWIAAQSADKKVTQGVWECTAGRFTWTFTWDEFVMILDGQVTIEEDGGNRYTLRAGDFAHFPLGLKTKWHVPGYIKKTFTLRTPEPLELEHAVHVGRVE